MTESTRYTVRFQLYEKPHRSLIGHTKSPQWHTSAEARRKKRSQLVAHQIEEASHDPHRHEFVQPIIIAASGVRLVGGMVASGSRRRLDDTAWSLKLLPTSMRMVWRVIGEGDPARRGLHFVERPR
jgi:hypothetical protein